MIPKIFATLGVLSSLRQALNLAMFFVPELIQAKVSIDRVDSK